jgi:TPR repeat protein
VLAADQGLALAQCALGNMYANLYHQCTPNVLYKAMYWLKKAARLGHNEAALPLSLLLLDSKALLFDAKCDVAGYSAIPEANYWFEMGTAETMEPHFVQRPRSLQLLECGNCGKSSTGTNGTSNNGHAEFKRCIKCKGVRYCGRDCQALHWAAGHKRDCKAVEALGDSMKGILDNTASTATGTGARL